MRRLVLMAYLGLSGCNTGQDACLLPGQTHMVRVMLYFGRDIPGGGAVSDADWADFARNDITPRFPDGFTVTDARGQWLNPRTGRIGQEATKIVEIVAADGGGTAANVAAVAEAYRVRFRQDAVGITSVPVCAAF